MTRICLAAILLTMLSGSVAGADAIRDVIPALDSPRCLLISGRCLAFAVEVAEMNAN